MARKTLPHESIYGFLVGSFWGEGEKSTVSKAWSIFTPPLYFRINWILRWALEPSRILRKDFLGSDVKADFWANPCGRILCFHSRNSPNLCQAHFWGLAELSGSFLSRTWPGEGRLFLLQGNKIQLPSSGLIGISVRKKSLSMAGSANF